MLEVVCLFKFFPKCTDHTDNDSKTCEEKIYCNACTSFVTIEQNAHNFRSWLMNFSWLGLKCFNACNTQSKYPI